MQENTGYIAAPCTGALAERTAVIMNSSGQWAVATQSLRPIGILERASYAANDVVTARTRGKFQATAAAVTMAVGDTVYSAASGVLTNVSTSAIALGVCVKGCASGGNFEWIPYL